MQSSSLSYVCIRSTAVLSFCVTPLSVTELHRPKLAPLLAGAGDILSKVDAAALLAQDVSGRIRELDVTKVMPLALRSSIYFV